MLDFTSFNSSEISWVLFGITLAVATFAYPYVSSKVLHSFFPEYRENEITRKIRVIWEDVFLACAVIIILYLDYFIVKALFTFLHWLGVHFSFNYLVLFTEKIYIGLSLTAFLVAIEFFVYVFVREKKKRQNSILRTKLDSQANPMPENDYETIEKLKQQNTQLLEVIRNLSEAVKRLNNKE